MVINQPFVVETENGNYELSIKGVRLTQKFIKENKDRKVLAGAISYDSKEKEHSLRIEEI